jgi:G3E family GTPase
VARARPERVVLETTGIAEPQAILDGLAALPPGRAPVQAAAVVTVVDADAGADQLERHPEARAQIAVADRLLLTKLDLAGPDRLGALHRALDALNPDAERATFPPHATAALAPWLLDARSARAPAAPVPHRPHAHGQLVATAFADDAPLLGEALLSLCRRLGPALVRAKGFVHLAGEDRRAFLERAGTVTELRLGDPWPGPRRTELVLIGENLDPGALQRELWSCRAPARD